MVLVGVSALGIGLREIHWTIIFIKPGVNGGNKWTLLPRLVAVREVASDIQECLDYYTVQENGAAGHQVHETVELPRTAAQDFIPYAKPWPPNIP